MAFSSLLRRLKYPALNVLSLDDPRTTEFHHDVILDKPFLRKLYVSYYREFVALERSLAASGMAGASIELGAGGGFLKELLPDLIATDVHKYDWTDRVENAYRLSFADESLKAIYMTAVLHHLGQPRAFFREALRTLKPGGVIAMMEPHMSTFGRLFFQYLHHEPAETESATWEFPQTGPLSDANAALPYLLFDRDRDQFLEEFPQLQLRTRRYHTFLLYGLSGGVSFRFAPPGAWFEPLALLEQALSPLMRRYLGTMQTVVLAKAG